MFMMMMKMKMMVKVKSLCCYHARLNRYEVMKIRWLSGIENIVSERDHLVFNLFGNFKPVKTFENMSDVLEFWSLDKQFELEHSGCVGDDLFDIYEDHLVQKVAVFNHGVYARGGNCFRGVKSGTGT